MTTPEKYAADHEYTPEELLALWTQCAARISVSGQSYRIGTREYTAADSAEVRRQIEFWESRCTTPQVGGIATNLIRLRGVS